MRDNCESFPWVEPVHARVWIKLGLQACEGTQIAYAFFVTDHFNPYLHRSFYIRISIGSTLLAMLTTKGLETHLLFN